MMRGATSARLAAAVLAATAGSHAPAAVHTWQGPGGTTATPTSGNWNDAANWEGGLPEFGDTTKDIRFNASAGNDGAGAFAANFDFGGGFGLPYQFAQLRFDSASATEQTIAGNQIVASFMTSEIQQNGPGDWRILAPLYHYGGANTTLRFTGSGSGILHIGQHGSDTAASSTSSTSTWSSTTPVAAGWRSTRGTPTPPRRWCRADG